MTYLKFLRFKQPLNGFYTGTTLCHSSSQMALTGVTPLLTKVLNGDPPGVVILAGSINHVNAVADQLAASSSITK